MICPDCRKGIVERLVQGARGGQIKWLPCPRFQGTGIAYCCDGEDWSGGTRCELTSGLSNSAGPVGDGTKVASGRRTGPRHGNC